MKKILFSIILLFGSYLQVTAQANGDFVDSTFSYETGNGLTLRLGKGIPNKISLGGTIQSGFQYMRANDANSSRLSINLQRLYISGSFLNDQVIMKVVTDFSNSQTPILEGWVGASLFKNHFRAYLGQMQTPSNNRLAMADERYSQVMGQSTGGASNDGTVYGAMMQNFVQTSREGGIFLESNFGIENFKIHPYANITTGEGQNFFEAEIHPHFKYGGRIDILPFGEFQNNGAFVGEDIYREAKPKLVIGVAGSYNVKTSSATGSESGTITGVYNKKGDTSFANYGKIVIDGMFKYSGFSLVAEYTKAFIRGNNLFLDNKATTEFTTNTASGYYNLGSGVNVQTSYVFKQGWSLGGRFSNLSPEYNLTNSLIQKQNWYTFSFNKYFKNNAVKLGTNLTYIKFNNQEVKTHSWVMNVAAQVSL